MKYGIIVSVMAGLLMCVGHLVSCASGDDDSGSNSQEPVDWLQACIDATTRLIGQTEGCVTKTNTDEQIQQTCSEQEQTAQGNECVQKAFEDLVTCLQAADCSDVAAASDAWNTCSGNYADAVPAC